MNANGTFTYRETYGDGTSVLLVEEYNVILSLVGEALTETATCDITIEDISEAMNAGKPATFRAQGVTYTITPTTPADIAEFNAGINANIDYAESVFGHKVGNKLPHIIEA